MTHRPGHDAAGKRRDPETWAMLDAEAKAIKARASSGSPDKNALAAKYGIDLSALQGASADPDDFDVIVGRSPGILEFRDRAGQVADQVMTRRASDLLRDFYRTPAEELANLQRRLYLGGFYAGDVDEDDIAFGDHDEDTLNALKRAIDRAGAFYESGEQKSLDDVIDGAARAREGKPGKSGKADLIALDNPEDLRRAIEAVASKAVGHKLSEDQREQFIGFFHALQRRAQQSAVAAQDAGGGVVTQAPSVETAAVAFAEQQDPEGAAEMDWINRGNEFLDLLRATDG